MGAGIDWSCLHYPWGAILAILWLYLIVVQYVLSGSRPALKRLYNNFSCILCLSLAAVMSIFEGCGLQYLHKGVAFTAILFCLTSSAALACADEVRHHRPVATMLAHIGIVIVLATMMCGVGDKQRVRVNSGVDVAVSVGVAGEELPFALTLKEFRMEEYNPKLYLLSDGKKVGECRLPDSLKIGDSRLSDISYGDWQIYVSDYLSNACRLPDGRYRSLLHIGACPAARVTAVCTSGTSTSASETRQLEGWVSCGSFLFTYDTLQIDEHLQVVMPQPQPKSFESLYTFVPLTDLRSPLDRLLGKKTSFSPQELSVKVNHPASTCNWTIYQAGYDTDKGKWSTSSIVDCVYDPWSTLKSLAFWILLFSGACMVVRGIRHIPGGRNAILLTLSILLVTLAFLYLIIFRHNLHKDLPPALQSAWYVPHVAVYIVSYSVLAVATVIALSKLIRICRSSTDAGTPHCNFLHRSSTDTGTSDCNSVHRSNENTGNFPSAESEPLSPVFLNLVRIGWGLLTMGLVMGALWAKQAWGDYWTWDPKETWAAATWLSWTIVLHLHPSSQPSAATGTRNSSTGTHASSTVHCTSSTVYQVAIISFLLLQMCWWGVKLLNTSSLHLYGK